MKRRDPAHESRPVLRYGPDRAPPPPGGVEDPVAVEEPLEIRIDGELVGVTMRTPGRDGDLAVGYLHGEGLLPSAKAIRALEAGDGPDPLMAGNVIDLRLRRGFACDPERLARSRRGTTTHSSCGVCGRKSVVDLLQRAGRVAPGPVVPLSILAASSATLRSAQDAFRATGGVHGAAALDAKGRIVEAAEDVGRHNAVDKVVGALLRAGKRAGKRPVARGPVILAVSGRCSFEMAQKAVAFGFPILAGVSAPTTLAVDLAEECNLTLAGFVRDGRVNLYAHPERVSAK